ncbi:DUF4236 domain-containing protein [Desulfurispira natronophila]|uniref:Uncharacterized protein n=1 Tax=Desulfurispira natronophila TaxID=682562 RepID=A0A7W8DGL3_9BACT|nr:DUF4236 domain-containing protein [Desulfurispira natronophila]MBB5021378.1 hypothetical protein [Desulfurispira natronophila]
MLVQLAAGNLLWRRIRIAPGIILNLSKRGVLLGLAEIYQLLQGLDEALGMLQQLHLGDLEIHLFLTELLLSGDSPEKQSAQQVAELIGDISNESEIHAALMLRALHKLEFPTAARNTLTPALRCKKRPLDKAASSASL